MSQVCWVSSRTTPWPMAWTVPASTKIMSPTVDGDLFEEGLHCAVVRGGFEGLERGAGFEAEGDGCAGVGFEDVPALGLAARLAERLGLGVVWMNLNGELVVWEEHFDEQGEFGDGSGRQESPSGVRGQVMEVLADQFNCRAGRDGALWASEPRFADQGIGANVFVPGLEVGTAPNTLAEEGVQAERCEGGEVGH